MDDDRVPAAYVVPVRADRAGRGGPTPRQVRGPSWRRTSQGFYVPSSVDPTEVGQRIVEASVVVPPRSGAITGWAALRWLGAGWFGGRRGDGTPLSVDVVSGTHDIRPQPGIRPSGEGLDPHVVVRHRGLRVTNAVFSTAFAMRHAQSDREAAGILDLACAADLVSVSELAQFLEERQRGWTGVPRARRAVPLADENAWSPTETRMRLVWHIDGGYAAPLTNRPLFDRGGDHVATPDLIDPEHGIAGEYDGAAHLTRERRDSDLVREEALLSHGIEVVTMTAADLADPSRLLGRLRRAYDRARSRPQTRRTWTLTPPEWWVPTHTVELRRALSEDQRRHFLRYRHPA